MSLEGRWTRFRSFWVFPLVAVFLLYATSRIEAGRSFENALGFFLLGVFLWTLLEYGLHRFVFHISFPLRNRHLQALLNASHLGHHHSPRDPDKVLVHPVYGMAVSVLVFGLLYGVFGALYSSAITLAGIWAGFLYYESVHYRVHFSLSGSGLVARQRRSHFYHHFTNNRRCFGVTSPFWDYVFRTAKPRR
jgi:sterol desaturase/sphingolipid hydroxylase (fatty acid hydroxylase superfamily)